jgi:pilus assembly protein CpaB
VIPESPISGGPRGGDGVRRSGGLRSALQGLVGGGRRAAWRRFALRRGLASAFAGLAVLGGLGTLGEQVAPRTVPVAVARTALAAGQRISPADLEIQRWPASIAPRGAMRDAGAAAGHVLAGPVGPGEALTDTRWVGSSLLVGQPAGFVAAVVPLLDRATSLLARPGARVDVVSPSGEVVARGAVVLAPPPGGSSGGVWDSGAEGPDSVVVAVEASIAPALARGGSPDGTAGTGFALVAHPD